MDEVVVEARLEGSKLKKCEVLLVLQWMGMLCIISRLDKMQLGNLV